MIAKNRVVPLKSPETTPRLVQAALIGSRLAKTVMQGHEFPIESCTLWSDSRTVLSWINTNPRTFETYEMNRLGEIRDETNVDEWRWVPTDDNPADDASRWVPEVLEKESRWFVGLPFLRENEISWPKTPDDATKINNLGISKEIRAILNIGMVANTISPTLLEINRFSSWYRTI